VNYRSNDKPYYDEEPIDIRYYLVLLRTIWFKYYPYILVLNVIGILIASLYVQSLAPSYSATVTLHVAPKDNTVFNLEKLYWGDSDSSFKDTQIGILQSNKLLRTVVEKLELFKVPVLSASSRRVGFLGYLQQRISPVVAESDVDDATRIEWAADELSTLISIQEPDESGFSNLLDITVTMAEPVLAANTANTWAESYINSVFMNEMETALKNQAFLTKRLSVLRHQLQEVEQKLRDFMESEDIVQRGSGRDEIDSELDTVTASYFKARQERARLENLMNQVEAVQKGGTDPRNVPAIASHPVVSRISSQIFDLEGKKSELSKRYGRRHNKMKAVESELATAKRALKNQIANVRVGILSDLKVAQRTEKTAEAVLEEVRDKKQSLGRKDFKLNELQQDIDVKREVYTVFLEKLNQDDAAGPVRNTNLWIADPATIPRRGVKLSWGMAIIATIFGCTVLSFGIGAILVSINNTLETEQDVVDKAGAQLLGILPIIKTEGEAGEYVPFREYLENLHSRFSEAIRSVRTSMTLLNVNKDINKILVTSCHQHEGKTSVALTLSASLGQTAKVLLIDADLRRPSVENAVNKGNHKLLGLADAISGAVSPDDCIMHFEPANIDVLPAGSRSLKPLELLGSSQFTTLLNDLSDRYDFIIIDSPPCSAVSDSYLLGSLTDTVIFVVKSGTASVTNIRSVLNRFRDLEVPVAGILLNQVDFESRHHPYYQGYYEYDGYGASDKPVKLNDVV
jgi:polysaccharide biosynthesis transport protein